MNFIYNLILTNIYLYICIIIALIILESILLILVTNNKKRMKIKNDFEQAEKMEEELASIEDEFVSSPLEEILKKMQEDIDVKPEDVVKRFEEEQEEKAIISYQELLDNVKAGKIEVVDDEDSNVNFVENLSIDVTKEVIVDQGTEEPKITPQMVKDAIAEISTSSIKEEPKKFKKSDFISPIYGIIDEKLDYPTVKKNENIMDIMNTRDYNKLTEEIKRQEEFLNALKEFRKNL